MSDKEENKPFGMEEIAKIAGLAASLSLPASFLFDWGYFDAIGMAVRQVPTSLLDHAKSAVFWFPLAILMAIWMAASQMVVIKLTSKIDITTQPIAQRRKSPAVRLKELRKKGRRLSATLLVLGIAFIMFYVVAGDTAFIFLIGGLSFLWFAFSTWSIVHPGAFRQWSATVITLVILVPPCVVTLWGMGEVAGRAVHFAPLSTRITVVGSAPQNVAVVRYLDKGLLARTGDGTVRFFPWAVVSNIDTTTKFDENDGLLCTRLHRCYWPLPDQYKHMR